MLNGARHKHLLLLFPLAFALFWLTLVASCAVDEGQVAAQAAPTTIPTTVGETPATVSATKNAATQPPRQPQVPTAVPLNSIVLIPTTAPALALTSPLPTPEPSAALTTTLALQSRVALSVALVAQSFLAAIQQPVDGAALPTITASVALTTPSGLLPPLPAEALSALPVVPTVVQSQGPAADVPESSAPEEAISVTFLPLVADGEVRTAKVPILMYHYLSDAPPNADIYRRDLSVPPSLFDAHLDRIAAEGYTVIRLYDLVAYLTEGTPLPEKSVVLTFDDGYRDNYENALPLLQEHGMTATFFVVMEFINRERPEYLTWPMVQEMAAAGMSIEAHGVDHTTLRGRSRADLEFQAIRSYETLQNALGVRARFISYPAGEFDEQTIELFQRADYWAGFTTVQGATHSSNDLFRLPRVRIRSTTTPDELARLLALDW